MADQRYLSYLHETEETELENTEIHHLNIVKVSDNIEDDETMLRCNRPNYEIIQIETESCDTEATRTAQMTKDSPRKRPLPSKSTKMTQSPPKVVKLTNSTSLNIALPKFVITSEPNSEDEDGGEPPDPFQDEEQGAKPVNKIKTLNISKVVLSREIMENESVDLQDICASSAGITEMRTVPDDSDLQSIYKCKYCPKAYASAHHLMMHTRKVHMCQYCLSVFEKVTDLYKHSKETHKTFECLMCGCVFRSNGNLRQHMRSYHSIFLPAYVSLLSVEKKT